jgi:putative oxidoreductase
MDVLLVIGRILFAAAFVSSGFAVHIQQREQAVHYARGYGAPAPELLVPLSGIAIIVGGLLVALGLWADIGALLIIGFLAGITPIMHAFWKETDPQQKQVQIANFTKNASLLGAAIFIFWTYNQVQDVDASLTDALLNRW